MTARLWRALHAEKFSLNPVINKSLYEGCKRKHKKIFVCIEHTTKAAA